MIKKGILILLSTYLFPHSTSAEIPIYNQLGVSYSNIKTASGEGDFYWDHKSFQLEYLHGLNRRFALGIYVGYGYYPEIIEEKRTSNYGYGEYSGHSSFENDSALNHEYFSYYTINNGSSLHYGINGVAHLLPILNLNSSFHDIYLNGRLGMISMFTTSKYKDTYIQSGHYLNYSLVGGYTLYAWQHIGFFVEYGYNISKYTKRTSARFGIRFDL